MQPHATPCTQPEGRVAPTQDQCHGPPLSLDASLPFLGFLQVHCASRRLLAWLDPDLPLEPAKQKTGQALREDLRVLQKRSKRLWGMLVA